MQQELEYAFEVECDLQDTENWGRKCFVNFNAGKSLRCWGCLCPLNKIRVLILSKLLKTSPRKLGLDYLYDVSFFSDCAFSSFIQP